MKKLLLLPLLIGFFVGDILCMKRSRSEESEEQRDQASDMEIDQKSGSGDSSDDKPLQQSAKRTRDKSKNSNAVEKIEKPSKKRSKKASSPTKGTATTPLIKAIKDKNTEQVRSIFDSGTHADIVDKFKNTALIYAVETGDLDLVKLVYDKSPLAKKSSDKALVVAAACGHKEIAEFLIANKARVDCLEGGFFLTYIESIDAESMKRFGKCQVYPLLLAAYYGHKALVKLLLEHRANTDLRRTGNFTPLLVALERGNDDIIEYLLEAGARVEGTGKIEAALVVAARYNREKWVKKILSRSKNVNPGDIINGFITALEQGHKSLLDIFMPSITDGMLYQLGSSSLIKEVARLGNEELLDVLMNKATNKTQACTCALAGAAAVNNKILAEKLIERGAHVSGYDDSPLREAVRAGHTDMVTFLLQAGAKVNVGPSWENVFDLARAKGHKEVLALLENARAKTEELFESCTKGDGVAVQELLKQGADATIMDAQHRTPLMIATKNGRAEIVTMLLEGKSSYYLENRHYLNKSLMLAAAQGHTDIVKILLNAGADVNARDWKPEPWNSSGRESCNFTPLIHAVINGHEETTKLLLAYKADTLLQDIRGKSALTWAKEKGNKTIEALLEAKAAEDKKAHATFLDACTQGNKEEVTRLFGDPINSEIVDEQGKTGLELAVEHKHTNIVALLLENDAHERNLSKALKLVAAKGDENMVKLLLNAYKNKLSMDTLADAVDSAAAHGHAGIVNLFIKQTSDRWYKRGLTERALYASIKARNVAFVKKILNDKKGKYWIDFYQSTYNNPLLIATYAGSLELVEFFLEKGCPLTVFSEDKASGVSSFIGSETQVQPHMNALMLAAQEGHIHLVEFLLAKGIPINTSNKEGETALSVTASVGRKDVLQLLLDKGAQSTSKALENAVQAGKKEIVQLLISKGASITSKVLSAAVQGGHEEILQILIDANRERPAVLSTAFFAAVATGKLMLVKKLHAQVPHLELKEAKTERTALMLALGAKKWDVAAFLLEAGANPYAKDGKGLDAFAYAKNSGYEEKFMASVREIEQRKAELRKEVAQKRAALENHFLQAAAQGDVAKVKKFITQGVNAQCVDSSGINALMYAAASGNRELVELLITQAGLSINGQSKDSMTALSFAVERGHEELVKYLINAGSHINIVAISKAVRQDNGPLLRLLIQKSEDEQQACNLALCYATECNKPAIITSLLKLRADVNTRSLYQRTPLIIAAMRGYDDCARVLLDGRADVTLKDDKGVDALSYAKTNGNEAIVRMLEEALSEKYQMQQAFLEASVQGNLSEVKELLAQGVDKNVQDRQGKTALMHAVTNEHNEVVELLLREGAQIAIRNLAGNTALSIATQKAHTALVKLLLAFPDRLPTVILKPALDSASYEGHSEIVSLLINAHPNKAHACAIALTTAVGGQKKELVKQLIELGADVNVAYGDTPLMVATTNNDTEMVKLLLSHGAHVNKRNAHNISSLTRAVAVLGLESFAILIGASPNVPDLINNDADIQNKIHSRLDSYLEESRINGSDYKEALKRLKLEEIALLLRIVKKSFPGYVKKDYFENKDAYCTEYIKVYKEQGKCTRNGLLQTPLIWACMFGHAHIVQQFIESEMPRWFINAQDVYGRTALHYAILYGHTECVQTLLKWYTQEVERINEVYKDNPEALKKALDCLGINLTDSQGNTALFYAIIKGNLNLVNELFKLNAKLATSETKAALALKIAAVQGYSDVVIRILFYLKEQPAIFK